LLEQGAVDRRRWWNRRIRLQGALIVAVVFAVGVTFSALGSPLWVAVLYLVLGVALAVLRLRADGPAPDGRRAIGYVHGRSRERTAAVRRFCERVLLTIPFASLDEITFKREAVGNGSLDARLRFTLYLTDAPTVHVAPETLAMEVKSP